MGRYSVLYDEVQEIVIVMNDVDFIFYPLLAISVYFASECLCYFLFSL